MSHSIKIGILEKQKILNSRANMKRFKSTGTHSPIISQKRSLNLVFLGQQCGSAFQWRSLSLVFLSYYRSNMTVQICLQYNTVFGISWILQARCLQELSRNFSQQASRDLRALGVLQCLLMRQVCAWEWGPPSIRETELGYSISCCQEEKISFPLQVCLGNSEELQESFSDTSACFSTTS